MIRCPACSVTKTVVKDSGRENSRVPYKVRRRKCLGCGHNFTTREIVDTVSMLTEADVAALRRSIERATENLNKARSRLQWKRTKLQPTLRRDP